MHAASIAAAAALLAIAAPPAEANPTDWVGNHHEGCTNNGIIIHAGLGPSTISCNGSCTNNGVTVQASPRSSYVCQGGCTNNGIMVFGPGGGCERGALPGACASDTCTPNCYNHCTSSSNENGDARIGPLLCRPIPGELGLECAHSERCAIMEDAACWSVRLACTIVGNHSRVDEILDERNIRCHSWSFV